MPRGRTSRRVTPRRIKPSTWPRHPKPGELWRDTENCATYRIINLDRRQHCAAVVEWWSIDNEYGVTVKIALWEFEEAYFRRLRR